ncbi:MAG: hypothetical protein HOV83_33895 [Catenulispora sp.]|nr:hypothetical protein [Catenulispora sp.]
MNIGKRVAAAAGSLAVGVTALTFLTAGTASASTYYGRVEDSWSKNCHGELYGQKTDSGAYQVLAQFPQQALATYTATCKGWIDQSWNGGATWKGLIGYQHYAPGLGGSSIGWTDDSSTVIRVCVQSDYDNTARCSGWW